MGFCLTGRVPRHRLRRERAKGRALLRRFRGGHFGAHGSTPYEVDPLLLTGSHGVVAEGEAIHVGVKVLDPFVQPAHQRQPIADDCRALERELFSRGVHGRFERADRGVATAVEKGAHGHRRVAIRLRCARTDARTGAGAELVSQTAGGAGAARAALWTRGGIVVEPERAAAARGAAVEEDLDAIARGEQGREAWLQHFYFGALDNNGNEVANDLGLKRIVANNLDEIDAAAINTFILGKNPADGEDVYVKPGKFGPYVRSLENTAGVPDTMTPEDLTLEVALELLAAPKGDEPIGQIDGFPVFAKTGRYGAYVQWGTPDNLPPGLEKPKMVSLFATMNVERLSMKDAEDLLSLPRTVGHDPVDGEIITAQNGRFGPYISKGKDSRTLQNEEQILSVNLEEALALLATPRVFGRGRAAPKPPLKEFGNDPVSGKPVVAKEGRFGEYVTDGETNAGLKRGDILQDMNPERAYELLQLRRYMELRLVYPHCYIIGKVIFIDSRCKDGYEMPLANQILRQISHMTLHTTWCIPPVRTDNPDTFFS
mgnify:CR=1 FL=1